MFNITEGKPETVVFNGVLYRRMGGRRLYYLSQSTTNEGRKKPKGLHVAIWEFHSGQTVPKGWHVHHKDSDTFNNTYENLECLPAEEHNKIPRPLKDPERNKRHLENIRPLAVQWHQSEEGREWHRKHGKTSWQNAEIKDYNCLFCGKHFQSKTPFAQYCGNACGYKYRKSQGHYRTEKECIYCGKTFTTDIPLNPSRVAKTCSKSCAMRWAKRKKD